MGNYTYPLGITISRGQHIGYNRCLREKVLGNLSAVVSVVER